MKKKPDDPNIDKEYDFRNGVRGKYATRYASGTNVVVLDPDVVELFADAESLNRALRAAWTNHCGPEGQRPTT